MLTFLVIRGDVAALNREVEAIRAHSDHASLDELRNHLIPLSTDGSNDDKKLEAYRRLLGGTFPEESPTELLKEIQSTRKFRQWLERPTLSAFRLRGITKSRMTGLCWLSCMVPHLIQELRERGNLVVFHLLQTADWMEDNIAASDVFSSTILQLLQAKPRILRDPNRFKELKKILSDDNWRSSLKGCCEVFANILRDHPGAIIVWDRIDRVQCPGGAARLAEYVLEALQAADCVVKILMIGEPGSDAEWEIDLLDAMSGGEFCIDSDGWEQEERVKRTPPRRR